MKNNKPEVVAIKDSDVGGLIELKPVLRLPHGTRLIRLSDYEALQAECEKLRKDAERLDFIAQHPGWLRSHKGRWGCVSPFTNYSYPVFKTPRDAIDAAIQASHE